MAKTYVTFGQQHYHRLNGKIFDKDCVAVIEAPDERSGREKAFILFDALFGTSYFEDQWKDDNLKWFPRGLINVEG